MDQTLYRCGNCELDSVNRRFSRDGKEVILEPKVFSVLAQLVARPGQLLRREELLDAVWGHRYVTPSTLNRVIALARRALLDDAGEPNFIQTVHGSGYRYVGPVEEGAAAPEPSLARFGPPPTARLPARIQTFLGREHELARLETLFVEGRSVTIMGTGGMGKTQCALAFAHSQLPSYPDGVWFFDLAPLQAADEWLQSFALALSIAAADRQALLVKITQTLADRRALCLLDNCDRLSVEVGALVVAILRGTDHLKILATSQQQLNFVGERLLPMPPLRLPLIRYPTNEPELREVAAAPAVNLLLTRIRDAQPEFVLSAANAPAIVSICERLDGMPLALELAAARFALLSPEQVLERLDHRFRFLVGDRAGRDQRHRNLLALLDWSFRLLSPEEQRFLACLGVFVQGWTVDAAVEMASAFGRRPETAVDLLTGLANKSLVSVDQGVSPPRYRLLESVREFALERLTASGDERRAREAHLAYVERMAMAAHEDMVGGRMKERLVLLLQEQGNIESASEYAVGTANSAAAALRIAGSLTLYFKAHGNSLFGAGVCDRALSGNPPVRTRERARTLMCRGAMGLYTHKSAPDRTLLEAVSIALEVGDDWTVAYSSGHYALWLVHAGRATEIGELLSVVDSIAERLDDDMLRGLAGLIRGWASLAEGMIETTLGTLRSVRGLGGDFHQHHLVDMYIALALFRHGDYASAADQWYESMRNALAGRHIRGVAGSIEGCAYLAGRAGRAEEACRFLGAADQIRMRTGSPLFSFWIEHNACANRELSATLGVDAYDAAKRAGASLREEDAANQAAALLRDLGTSASWQHRSTDSNHLASGRRASTVEFLPGDPPAAPLHPPRKP